MMTVPFVRYGFGICLAPEIHIGIQVPKSYPQIFFIKLKINSMYNYYITVQNYFR